MFMYFLPFFLPPYLWDLVFVLYICKYAAFAIITLLFPTYYIINNLKNYYIVFKFFKFLAALGLRCYTQALSSCSERGLLFVAVRRLLIVVASLVAEHRL